MPEPGARTTRPPTRVIAVHTRTAVTRGHCVQRAENNGERRLREEAPPIKRDRCRAGSVFAVLGGGYPDCEGEEESGADKVGRVGCFC